MLVENCEKESDELHECSACLHEAACSEQYKKVFCDKFNFLSFMFDAVDDKKATSRANEATKSVHMLQDTNIPCYPSVRF